MLDPLSRDRSGAGEEASAMGDIPMQLIEQVLDLSSECVLCVDREWRFSYLNRAARELMGRDDLVGLHLWTEYPTTPFESAYYAAMNERIMSEFEGYAPSVQRWVKVRAQPFEGGVIIFSADVSDRKLAEDRQDATARQLAQVLEATTDAVLSLDRRWTIRFINQHGMTLVGRHDLIGKDIWEEFPAVVHSEIYGHYHRAMDERIPASFETYFPEPLNRWFWIQCRPSEDGIVVLFRDIDDERRAKQELVNQQESLAFIQEAARIATWSVDLNSEEIHFSDGSYPVYGRHHDHIRVLDDIREIVLPEDLPVVLASGENALHEAGMTSVDYRVVLPDGAIAWLERRCVRVMNAEGIITHLRGMTTDITARKQNEERLGASEERYRVLAEETERQRAELEAIYENAPIGLALFDPVDFRWLRLNETQAEITGMNKEELLHTRLFDLVKIPGVREMFEGVARGTPVLDQLVEGELPTRPGEHRYWTVNYHPVYGTDGTIQAITAASLEITQQRKSELALIQSEKLAAVGRLASSISHEINNPLEAITNLLYLVSTDEKLHEEVKVYVHMAQSELARVSQIATQTLRFHRQAVKPTLVTAAELVGAVLGLYHGRLSNSGIRVEAVYASATPVLCFENDIRQVLNNLIANAIDAMRTGGRLLARAHDATEWSGGKARQGVRITIADTGHGMSAAVKARVFEPFYTTKDLNGTGLGLWISAGIVQHHQGRLTVRSSQVSGRSGTVFTLFLPLVDV